MDNRRHFTVLVLVAALTVAGTSWRRALQAAPAGPPLAVPGTPSFSTPQAGSATSTEATRAMAPAALVDTGLYERDRPGVVAAGNWPFSPQYPLWSDGAGKRRWIYLPEGSTIDTRDNDEWEFPVGTKLWKEFAFGGRKIETRFLWKAGNEEWVFASYVWDAEGTSAVKAPDDGLPQVAEIAPGKSHSIPSITECRACHVSNRTEVLGFTALQLSTDRDPNAVHGEPLEPGMTTVATLLEEGRLAPARTELVSAPPRIAARTPDERAVLGYLAGNCGVCHNRKTDLSPLGLHWKHGEVASSGAGTAERMLAKRTKWQVPGVPDGESQLIDLEHPEQSALVRRMKSRHAVSQMPPIGTVLRDGEALTRIERWIASMAASRSAERPR